MTSKVKKYCYYHCSEWHSCGCCEDAIAILSNRVDIIPLCKNHLMRIVYYALRSGFTLRFLDKVEEVLFNLDRGTV